MFTIPSWRQSLEDPPAQDPAVYPQAQFDPIDLEIIIAGMLGRGVVSGCAVTQASPTGMKIDVEAGSVAINSVLVSVSGQTDVTVAAASSQPRKDLVVVDDAGSVDVVQGLPAVSSPQIPALDDDVVAIAVIYIPGSLTAILNTHITPKDWPVNDPTAGSIGVVRIEATDETGAGTRSSSAALAMDSQLQFPVDADTNYWFHAVLFISATAAADLRLGFNADYGGASSVDRIRIRSKIATGAFGAVGTEVSRVHNAYQTTAIPVTSTVDFLAVFEIEGIINNGSDAGDFGPTWAQNVAIGIGGDTVRLNGSYIEYKEV